MGGSSSKEYLVTTCIFLLTMFTVPYGNRACSGGSVETSLMYVIDSKGLDTEGYYPYKERVSVLNTEQVAAK